MHRKIFPRLSILPLIILMGCNPAPARATSSPSQSAVVPMDDASPPTQPSVQGLNLIYFTGDNGCEIQRFDAVEGKSIPINLIPTSLCIEDNDHWTSKRWSPDGRQFAVALMDAAEGTPLKFSLHVARFDGSGEYTLISGSGGITPQGLSWSPDGKRLAYVVSAETQTGGEAFVLRVAAVDGQGHTESGYVQLTDETISLEPIPGGEIDWSPDGRWIALTAQDTSKRTGIYLANSTENNFRLLADNLPMNTTPDFSPDGRWIAYADGLEWKVMDIAGDGRTIVSANNTIDIFCLAWSPDSAEILCLSQPVGNPRQLAAQRIDRAGGMRILIDDSPLFIRDISNAQWSPDGTMLALRDLENYSLWIYSPERAAMQNTGVQTRDDFAWFSTP